MENNTTNQYERQRQGMLKAGALCLILVGVVYLYQLLYPATVQPEQPPRFYYPDPTPYVVHNEYNFLSKNQICIGINQCN